MTRTMRIQKLLISLRMLMNDMAYYDDETDDENMGGTEEDYYKAIMQDEEIHFLGAKFVKQVIHILFTDYEFFEILEEQFKVY